MDLREGEHIIFEGHPSWRAILSFYIKGLVIALLAGAIGLLVGSTGVGIAIAPDQLSVARVRGALERVLTDASFRTAAQGTQAEISAMPTPDAVVEALERRYAT